MKAAVVRYVVQLLVALDQVLNVLLCNGWADETMSANAWRMEQEGKPWGRLLRPVIDALVWVFQRDHCRKAHESELLRLQSAPSTRTQR